MSWSAFGLAIEGKAVHTLSELAVHLASEDVEEVGRRSHVGNLHVAVLMLTIKLIF